MNEQWIFGIDGGGTSTRLRIESLEGSLLFQSEGPSLNPRSAGWDGSQRTLVQLFSEMYEQTGLVPDSCLSGFAGVAGIDRAEDTGTMLGLIRNAARLGPDTALEVKNDSIPALAGAFGELRGILLIAGTGSIAVGANGAGRIIRSGGWGHILGDEGSAYWVGLRALNAAIRFHDRRGPQTDLLGSALAFFEERDPFALIPAVYEPFDKARIAAFARIVAEERERGDEVAEQIFKEAAEELALLAISIATRLGEVLAGGRIAFAGGFLSNNERLWHDTEARIIASLPRHRIYSPQADAASGACLLARQNIEKPRF
ncbi:MAG: BadF/BadG/BcrA/BcrD ATPase family protein [Spirochaetia bacterium]|nr:BadF/BadG/BcrA/BcrD ATPase family protein [Spirochaetia bacterium]